MPDEDDDLFKPTTFKEKVHNRTPDLLFLALIMVVTWTVIDARMNGYIPNNNNTEQKVKQVFEIKQTSTIYYNDSINQKIR